MEPSRRSALKETCFAEIVSRVVQQASLITRPELEPADNRAAVDGTRRATFSLAVDPNVGDLLHNALSRPPLDHLDSPLHRIGAGSVQGLLEGLTHDQTIQRTTLGGEI
jgi:hypothetical protein